MMGELFKIQTNILTSPDLCQYERGKLSQLKACVKKPISQEEKKFYAFNYVGII